MHTIAQFQVEKPAISNNSEWFRVISLTHAGTGNGVLCGGPGAVG